MEKSVSHKCNVLYCFAFFVCFISKPLKFKPNFMVCLIFRVTGFIFRYICRPLLSGQKIMFTIFIPVQQRVQMAHQTQASYAILSFCHPNVFCGHLQWACSDDYFEDDWACRWEICQHLSYGNKMYPGYHLLWVFCAVQLILQVQE